LYYKVLQNAHIVLHKYAEIQQNPVFMHVGTRGTMGQDQGKSKKAKGKSKKLTTDRRLLVSFCNFIDGRKCKRIATPEKNV